MQGYHIKEHMGAELVLPISRDGARVEGFNKSLLLSGNRVVRPEAGEDNRLHVPIVMHGLLAALAYFESATLPLVSPLWHDS